MKRALTEAYPRGVPVNSAPDKDTCTNDLRDFILGAYSVGKQVDGAFVAGLCWHITKSAGKGVEDLATHRKQAAKHGNSLIKHVLATQMDDPDLEYTMVPSWDKKTCARVKTSVPMHLPSAIFTEHFASHEDPPAPTEPEETLHRYNCASWLEHPCSSQTNYHWSRVVPCSLYWDAAQYTIRDIFLVCIYETFEPEFSHSYFSFVALLAAKFSATETHSNFQSM